MYAILVFSLILSYLTGADNIKLSEINQCKWKQNQNATNARVSYINAQLWKVILNSTDQIKLVLALENAGDLQNWDVNDGIYYDIFVEFQNLKNVSKLFRDYNIRYVVATTNLQRWIDDENPPRSETYDGHDLSWTKYHRLKDIDSFMDYLIRKFPNLCTMKVIGTSIEGRSLRVLKISNGKPRNKAVWIDGGIHAREWITPAVVTYIIRNIVENWGNQSSAVKNIDWHFLPIANPDGYEFSHTHDRLWRKNRRQNGSCPGTDLNRNFGIEWGGVGTSKCPCHNVYGGSGPFSEPESQAIRNYITVTQKSTLWHGYLAFHSYGQIVFHPGNSLKTIGKRIAQNMQSIFRTFYNVESRLTGGGADNWAKYGAGMKYAYTLEMRDLGQNGFILPAYNIKPSGEEGLAAVRVIANAVQPSGSAKFYATSTFLCTPFLLLTIFYT